VQNHHLRATNHWLNSIKIAQSPGIAVNVAPGLSLPAPQARISHVSAVPTADRCSAGRSREGGWFSTILGVDLQQDQVAAVLAADFSACGDTLFCDAYIAIYWCILVQCKILYYSSL
jgi:hypothetical protein